MECFYSPARNTPLTLNLEEILPGPDTPALLHERAAYQYYIEVMAAQPSDATLSPFRTLATAGALQASHFEAMNDYLDGFKSIAINTSVDNSDARFAAYAQVNSQAMLLAQILFVDNLVKEDFLSLLTQPATDNVLTALCAHLRIISENNGAILDTASTSFFALLFVLQTAFDKLYVPDTDIVRYDTATGRFSITEHYNRCTEYLGLSGKKKRLACAEEQQLCRNITTGWGDGIDLATWNALNTTYYSGLSATTGKENLFTRNYDRLLERMIPQFVRAKIRLADSLLSMKSADRPLTILEIGAGSGALAIDLIMAAKRSGQALDQIRYVGVEPSAHMRGNFRRNCEHKIGDTQFPEQWQLIDGSVESVNAEPGRYLGDEDTLVVFSFSIHHCFHDSVKAFFANDEIKRLARGVLVLDALETHGWTKAYYMWADCESPENFDNVLVHGLWHTEALWQEPERQNEDYGWCFLQKLT